MALKDFAPISLDLKFNDDIKNSDITFSSELLNYIEPVNINGFNKTRFYTKNLTNFKVNDKVYIIGGNYDTYTLIATSPYTKNANGYKILSIDACSIVLDLDYSNTLPYNSYVKENTIKITAVTTQEEFDYYNMLFVYENSFDIINLNIPPKHSLGRTRFDILHNNILFIKTSIIFNSITLPSGFYKRYIISGVVTWNNVTTNFLSGSYPAYFKGGNNGTVLSEVEDIVYLGNTIFKKGRYYKYDNSITSYKILPQSNIAYITKANFRNGTFNSTWNDGVYGQHIDNIDWNGSNSIWNNGIFINSNWNSGSMDSKIDKLNLKFRNYYAKLENGLPKVDTDFTNNYSYGYNYATLSKFNNGNINNGVFYKNDFLGLTSSNVFEDYYSGTSSVSTSFTVNGGNYIENNANNVSFNNANINLTDIKNSRIDNTTFNNNYIDRSILSTSTINVNEYIKITGYEVYDNVEYTKGYIRTYRFYVTNEDVYKLKYSNKIFLKNLIVSDSLQTGNTFTMFDEGFYIGEHIFKNNGINFNVNTAVRTSWENKYIPKTPIIQTYLGTDTYYTSNTLTVNPNKFASIDISFSHTTFEVTYNGLNYPSPRGLLLEFPKLNIDITNAYIINANIDKSLVVNSDIKNATITNVEDYNTQITSITSELTGLSSSGSMMLPQLTISTYTTGYNAWLFNQVLVGDIIWLNNIYYDISGTKYDLSQQYLVVSAFNHQFDVIEYHSTTNVLVNINTAGMFIGKRDITSNYSGTYIIPSFTYIDTIRLENTTIEKGLYSKLNFVECTFDNNVTNLSEKTLSTNNTQLLKINRAKIYAPNSLIIKSGYWYNSIFSKVTIDAALINESTITDSSIINGGTVIKTLSIDLIVNGATLYDNNFYYLTNNYVLDESSLQTLCLAMTLNSGLYEKSILYFGIMNGGKIINSFAAAFVINNGIIGDINTPNENTNVSGSLIYNATVYSGLIGLRDTIFNVNTEIFNITMNGGKVIGSSDPSLPSTDATIWHNGTFNKGEIGGNTIQHSNVVWEDGVFNDGYFNSAYGDGITTYSWNGGTMSGGTFGTSSTWKDGVLNGGIFSGKIWNSGKMLNGKFIGSGDSTLIATPQSYISSFTASPTASSYYGLWRDGLIIDNVNKFGSNINYTQTYDVNQKNINDGVKIVNKTVFSNAIFLNGTVSHNNFTMNDSLFISGNFYQGDFNNSNFNPYVTRPLSASTSFSATQSYDLEDTTRWYNGQFLDGRFQISEFDNGVIQNGIFNSMRFNNGVVNYASFYNSIFAAGQWRNGNWYGSDYVLFDTASASRSLIDSTGTVKDGRRKDEIVKQMIRKGTASMHVWNLLWYNPFAGGSAVQYDKKTNNDLFNFNPYLSVSSYTYSMPLNITFSATAGYFPNGSTYTLYNALGTFNESNIESATQSIYTKVGNGDFQQGVWEAGVWNNGYKDDEHLIKLDTIQYIQLNENTWNLTISGLTFSGYKKGDIIQVGNIVAIDINDNRKLIKDTFKILNDVNENGDTSLNFIWNTTFPIRRIERDSNKHLIHVTKNVWLNGGLLSGRFKNTVWGNGILRGSLNLTRIDNTHFIDGRIISGYFSATQSTYIKNGSYTHSIATYSTGLVQNMIFEDKVNFSSITYQNTNVHNTFMDVNYATYSYTNICNEKSWGVYNSPFLYQHTILTGGYITEDILSSVSTVFDPLTTVAYNISNTQPPLFNTLNLGIKYKKYDNYLQKDGLFSASTLSDIPDWKFYNTKRKDLQYSQPYNYYVTTPLVYGTSSISSTNLLLVSSSTQSGTYSISFMNNKMKNIPTNRYIVYEYDVISATPTSNDPNIQVLSAGLYSINKDLGVTEPTGYHNTGTNNPAFNQAKVTNNHKIEYFYNPITLESNSTFITTFAGTTNSSILLDNIKYTEVDMIPFYNSLPALDIRAKIPLIATSPFIDYTNNQFSFIDNITFKFDNISTDDDIL